MMEFFLCFIPLFVALDPVGILPTFLGLTAKLEKSQRKKVIFQSMITALVVSFLFMITGQPLLNSLGITINDFMVAGGALLFIFSLKDLMIDRNDQPSTEPDTVGAVPIGVPLIAGPGLLTTTLVLAGQYGWIWTGAALGTNIVITGGIFLGAGSVTRFLGKTGTRTVGKIANLFLAAIAVMFIRKGLMGILGLS